VYSSAPFQSKNPISPAPPTRRPANSPLNQNTPAPTYSALHHIQPLEPLQIRVLGEGGGGGGGGEGDRGAEKWWKGWGGELRGK